MINNAIHLAELNAPVQTVRARVELHKGSTLEMVCSCGDYLNSFSIERTGEGKFFGFGICQKLLTVLMDGDREINLTPEHTIEVSFGVGANFLYPYPNFYVVEAERDEEANDLTVIAYDILYKAAEYTVADLPLSPPYTLRGFTLACAAILGVPLNIDAVAEASFNTLFEEGANFDGTENLRTALNAVAEATQTIYFINKDWELTFKRLDRAGDPVKVIDKTEQMAFKNNGNITLGNLAHVTELGDNVSTPTVEDTITQYIRENPFWELREDVGILLDNAQAVVGGTAINQFECEWFGSYLLEIGDKIGLITRDDETIISYILDDAISFEGAFTHYIQWHYDENSAETESNPSSLGEALNKTFARVDKANREIRLVSATANSNKESVSALQINTEEINASVRSVEKTTSEAIDVINQNFETLSKEVKTKITSNEITAEFITELGVGANSITTKTTGYTFNDEGLTINKSDSEMTTQITEDGMTISRSGQETLVANNQGVNAENLHATTYLIIGNNSRFEDWGGRTACFWIGG